VKALVRAVAVAVAAVVTTVVQAQSPHSFIWKVSSSAGSAYLVGSVHVLAKDYYPLAPALEAAYKGSDLLVEEMNLDEITTPDAQMRTLARGLLPGGQTLDMVVSPTTYALVTARTQSLGLPLEPLKRFKPWMLALTVVALEWQKAGFDDAYGLDRHFFDRAKAEGKPIQGFESADFQLGLLDGLSAADQDRMLAESLKESETELGSVAALAMAWKNGDAPTIERLVLSDMKDDPVMYNRLLADRNRAWVPAFEALLARKARPFVVVGAAHLVGPDGLLALLKARGYSLEQL